jgi:alpha-tubulin suppressor-like RCC1 family protein
MTWTDDKNLGPWTFEKRASNYSYNDGDLIATSSNPVWDLESGSQVTDTHIPCGYWYDQPYVFKKKPPTPTPTPTPTPFSIYSCGGYSNGKLIRTVIGTNNRSYVVIDKSNILSYSPGSGSSFVIDEDNALWGIGGNGSGCLGVGHSSTVTVLTQIFSSGISFCHLSNGGCAGFIIKTDGTLWSTGDNNQGQLGLGDEVNRNTFTQVGVATDWVSVWNNYYVTYGLKTNGDLWSWGLGAYGATGHGDTTQRKSPVKVLALSNIVTYKVGYFCAFAIDTSGKLYVVGQNTTGNLALNDITNRASFTQATGTWLDVCPAQSTYVHTMLIDTGGKLYGVGTNNNGQLGLGDTAPRTTVTQVGTDTNWQSVTCGSIHSIALKTTGSVYGSGGNLDGVLGVGDMDQSTSFALAGTGYYSVQTTSGHTLAAKAI